MRVTHQDGTITSTMIPAPEINLAEPAFLRAEREVPAAATDNSFYLFLRDGQRFPGRAGASSSAEFLTWTHPTLGAMTFPMKSVRGMAGTGLTPKAASATEDLATLRNGDTVRGILTVADAEGITLAPAAGEPVRVQWSAVAGLALADLGGGAVPPKPGWHVELTDGTMLRAAEVTGTVDGIKLGERAIPWTDIVLVERLGPAWSLALLPPAEAESRPYLTIDHPPAFGEAWVAGTRVRRAVTVSPRTRLAWIVPEGITRFRSAVIATRGATHLKISAGGSVWEKTLNQGESASIDLSVSPPSQPGVALVLTADFPPGSVAGQAVLSDPLLLP